MKNQEHIELEHWLADNVMGFDFSKEDYDSWSPTNDKADAMQVLERCAEKLAQINHALAVGKTQYGWRITDVGVNEEFCADAETVELATCLFAKKLFTK